MSDVHLHILTIGPETDFDLDLAQVVLLHLYDSYEAEVLVLFQQTEGD